MPDKIPCPACGTENLPTALHCQVCDYALALPPPAASSSKCGRCGSLVVGDAAFCPVCGQGIQDRHPRPPTGALNVRKMFGDGSANLPQHPAGDSNARRRAPQPQYAGFDPRAPPPVQVPVRVPPRPLALQPTAVAPNFGSAPSDARPRAAPLPQRQVPPSAPEPRAGSHGATRTRLFLVGRDGSEGESFPVPAQGIEVGRATELRFPADPFVSPRHCRVTPIEGGGVSLQDLDSRNGVYVRLREGVAVFPGDYFLLGNEVLRLDRVEPRTEKPGEPDVRGFGTPAKPPWALLTRLCLGEIEDDRYHLRGSEMIIGREEGDIVFPHDGFLSRQHARVLMQVHDNSMSVVLEDLDSANGTYLRIRRTATVTPGGMFRVGDQLFRVRVD